ncbi:MAG: aminopeptidase [Burkholderiales bacterium]|nr:aminopeptidase [Anaerolineae bacterium]
MTDIRHEKMAHVLINYSLRVKPGQKLLIGGGTIAAPLIRECYREATRAGALITVRYYSDDLREITLRDGSDAQIEYVSELEKQAAEYFDAELHILSEENTRAYTTIDPKRLAKSQAARAPLGKRFDARAAVGELRWVLTLYPTHAYAQDAGMSLSEYEDVVYKACLLDHPDPAASWREIETSQQRIADFLMKHDEIHIITPDTDVTYRVGGRKWISCAGEVNFPDGEVFSAPIEDSVSGTVQFTYPAVYNGNTVEGARLTFKNGRVVEATASKGQDFLISMLDMDEGARNVGEVAFGLNYGITRAMGETLFDEKIGGTMHMAVGSAYPESGGSNDSGLHWDMVCDLKQGKVYADGELCYEAGKFII